MKVAFAVRAGERADREFVRDLGRRTVNSSVSAARVADADDAIVAFERLADFVFERRHEALIAEEGGARIGFLLLVFDIPDEVTLARQAFVAYTAVEPRAQGRGAGRSLMAAAEERARNAGLPCVSLMVSEDNVPARRLYEALGYATERRLLTKSLC